MTHKQLLLALLGCCALAACAPKDAAEEAATGEDAAAAPDAVAGEPATTADEDLCSAAEYQSLVGSNIAAVTLPGDLHHRVLGPNDVATMDYRPDRLNIMTDEAGVIIEVKCG